MGLEIIRAVMTQKGITSESLSEMCGVPKSTIDKIAAGITDNPRFKTIKNIVNALGMSIDEFIELVDETSSASQENELLYQFRQLNDDGKARALQSVKDMVDSKNYGSELDLLRVRLSAAVAAQLGHQSNELDA